MEQERFLRVPFVSLSATSVTEYYRTFDRVTAKFLAPGRLGANGEKEDVKPPKFNIHIGTLSDKAKRQLTRSVNNLLLSVDENIMIDGKGKENVTFITLTLPSSQIASFDNQYVNYYHTDKVIKHECLNQFLTEIKNDKGVKNFVWVAEKQLNGNIHFHILVDKKIKPEYTQKAWNRIINKLGYVDRYAEKMKQLNFEQYCVLRKNEKTTIEKLQKAYNFGKSTNWMSPNSTDTAPLQKVNNVSAYIAKYVSKGFGHEDGEVKKIASELSAKYELSDLQIKQLYTIDGRIWQCSRAVSKSRKCVDLLEDTYKNEINNLIKESEKTGNQEVKVFTDEHFTTLCVKFNTLKNKMKTIYQAFMQHIKKCFNDAIPNEVVTVSSTIYATLVPPDILKDYSQLSLQFS